MRKMIAALLSAVLLINSMPLAIFAQEATSSDEKLLSGKTISVMGDSISTYMGYSDSNPISDESCTYRFGEPYYGPAGSDCHCTDYLVTDTWWHQAATQLGAEILISNAGNSTGVLWTSYPPNADWQQYLTDLAGYKTRPYYMGTAEQDPDIIALYLGSADMGRFNPACFGSIDDVNFDTLITQNTDGSYTYAEPQTVAEAYCVLLHKLQTTYPGAEIYCFTTLPNSGGTVSTIQTRLKNTLPFNEMLKGVAKHHGAILVDLFEEFGLDPDRDGIVTQEALDKFQPLFFEGPHPNPEGFDVITKAFVNAIKANSRYIINVETTAGKLEQVAVSAAISGTMLTKQAADFVTPDGLIVNYQSSEDSTDGPLGSFDENYTVKNNTNTYQAGGGSSMYSSALAPNVPVDIPLRDTDLPGNGKDDTQSTANGREIGVIDRTVTDAKDSESDGIYEWRESKVAKSGFIKVKTKSVTVSDIVSAEGQKNLTYVYSPTRPTETNDLINYTPLVLPQTTEEIPAITPGYEYVYLGSDQLSHFYAAYQYTKDDPELLANESPVYSDETLSLYTQYDHNVFVARGLVVPNLFLKNKTVSGSFPAWYESIQQFTLTNQHRQFLTAYCADQNTPTISGYSYRMLNMKDASYYSLDEARMIHTIVQNGYWGAENGVGSLAYLKEQLANSNIFTQDEINAITDGVAMTATQYAIWSYSNKMDNKLFTNAYYSASGSAPKRAADQDKAALVMKLFHYLTDLPPSDIDVPNARTIVINNKNFINSLSLNPKQIADHPNNFDTNTENDVYLTDLSFSLAATVNESKGDSLTMKIMQNEELIAIGRVVGQLQEGEVALAKEGNCYTFKDIPLQEGEQNIRFEMSGVQNLEKDAYLLISEEKNGETSQTLVCVAEGMRDVHVQMDISFDMEAENEIVTTSHVWRTEKTIKDDVRNPETKDNRLIFILATIAMLSLAATVYTVLAEKQKQFFN